MTPGAIVSTALAAPGDLDPAALLRGESAVRRLDLDAPIHVGAPAPLRCASGLPRAVDLALLAGRRLGLEGGPRYGLVLGLSSLHSEPRYLEPTLASRQDREGLRPLRAWRGDRPLRIVAEKLGLEGPALRIDTACASGSDALITAQQWLDAGLVEDVVVLAASAMLHPVGLALFHNLRALSSRDDLAASRPFDLRRDGFVMGEGAAGLWLSRRRPSRPLGFLLGWGQSMNAHKITDMPEDLEAMAVACRGALGGRRRVDYICAHGTSTPANDRCENRLYRHLFPRTCTSMPISSVKSMTGHCLGASSLLEVVVSLAALSAGKAPPNLNLEHPDPDCDLDYIAGSPRPIASGTVLSNAFAFGGHNSSVLLGAEADA